MSLPASLPQRDRDIIYATLQQMQELIKEVIPYVRDFQMICETPEEELLEGQLVHYVVSRPQGRRCNALFLHVHRASLSQVLSGRPKE